MSRLIEPRGAGTWSTVTSAVDEPYNLVTTGKEIIMSSNRAPRCAPLRLATAIFSVALAFSWISTSLQAQSGYVRSPISNEAWVQPFPPVRIIGNLYHVGTYDLASYLITTPEGHFLINTGAYDSAAMIRSNIEELGFNFEDIEILLTTQAHMDLSLIHI